MDKRNDAWKQVDRHGPFKLGADSDKFMSGIRTRFIIFQEEMVIDCKNQVKIVLN